MGTTSLAIWNKKRIVVAIATGTWAVSVIFAIQSELLRLSFFVEVQESIQTCCGIRYRSGK